MGRGVVLLAVALLLGIVLLNATDEQPPGANVAAGPASSGGSATGNKPTTTTAAPTTTLPAKQPKDVKAIVANASDTKGAASRASDQLKAAGYNVLAPANSTPRGDSAVYYAPGFDREAAAVATALGFPATAVKPLPTPSPVPDLKTANVLVVLGSDHAGRFGTPAGATTTTARAGGAATTTTARAGGTTTTTAKPAATTSTTKR
jgi:hypothetical protein